MTSGLTRRQAQFVQEYLIDLDGKNAAIRAGYSPRSAEVTSCRMLKQGKVAAAVAEAMRERSEATKIDARWVLEKLTEIVRRCMQEVRPALGRDGRQVRDADGNALYRFDATAANRALELIARHTDVRAFDDRITVQHDIVERINAGLRRTGRAPIDAEFREVRPALPHHQSQENDDYG